MHIYIYIYIYRVCCVTSDDLTSSPLIFKHDTLENCPFIDDFLSWKHPSIEFDRAHLGPPIPKLSPVDVLSSYESN